MSRFCDYKSCNALRELAKNPVDLTREDLSLRIKRYVAKSSGFLFFFGLQRISDEVLEAFLELSRETKALEKFSRMREGESLNYVEGGKAMPALHTACRDFFEERVGTKEARDASDLAYREVYKLKKFSNRKYETIIQIGIGGSIVGVKAIYNALKYFSKDKKRVYFISNVDPDNIRSVLEEVDLSKTLIISVSKSGKTLETLTNEEFIRDELKKKGLSPNDHIVAITAKGSPMDDLSRYMEIFYIWDYVGGRFSVTSMVGGVLLSSSVGFDSYLELLKGANRMDIASSSGDIFKNFSLLSALLGIWNRNFLGCDTMAFIPYSKPLEDIIPFIQQCEMESNGKSIDQSGKRISFKTSPIIWGDSGTDGQHTFFQLLHQGSDIVPVEFFAFLQPQTEYDKKIGKTTSQQKLIANFLAQGIALARGKKDKVLNKSFEGNRPSSMLLTDRLTPFRLGSIISYLEARAIFQGFIWGINSFDQEGVELGKSLSKRILDLFLKNANFREAEAFLEVFNLLEEL